MRLNINSTLDLNQESIAIKVLFMTLHIYDDAMALGAVCIAEILCPKPCAYSIVKCKAD